MTQLTSIKKQPTMSMRDFTASFNKIVNRIPTAARPIVGNLMNFFISAMPLDINHDLRREHPTDLDDTQKKEIECEEDLISMGNENENFILKEVLVALCHLRR